MVGAASRSGAPRAILWAGPSGAGTDLTPASFVGAQASATSGVQQVGFGEVSAGLAHALLWSGTAASAVDLTPAGLSGQTQSEAFGFGGGQIVGFLNGNSTGTAHAFIWDGKGGFVDLQPTAEGLTAIVSSQANSTDGVHQVGFGYYGNAEGPTHALLWSGTAASAIDLNPTLLSNITSSTALGVGGDEEVGYGNSGSTAQALLWTGTASSAVNLNPAGFVASTAKATNGLLQVGSGLTSSIATHAIVWSGTAESAVDLQNLLPTGVVWSSSSADSMIQTATSSALRLGRPAA